MELLYLLKCLVLFLVVAVPMAWRLNCSFRYTCKMTAYYCSVLLCSIWCTVVLIFKPRDPDNMAYVCWVQQVCSAWLAITWEPRGTEHLDVDTSAVLVCNHQSSIDCQGMGYVWPKRCCVMAKKSLMYVPFFGWAAWLANTVFVDRFNAGTARAALQEVIEDIKKRNLKLWVFPEGTRNHGEGLLPFKKGAFHIAVQAQVPIIPVVFSDMDPFYSKTEMRLELDGYVIAQVLPQVPTAGLTSEDVGDLCDKVRTMMLDCHTKISKEAREKYLEKRAAISE